jgi:hypothetical protein
MNDHETGLAMIQLRKALQQAALPAQAQIARLRGFDVPLEVADDVHNYTVWVLQCTQVKLTDLQRSTLVALDALTTGMSGPHNAELWTTDALQCRPEWEEVRRLARTILEAFQWPIEDGENDDIEVV